MMKPITFSCAETLRYSGDEIAEQILNLANWPDFKGFAVLPGIATAEFEVKTPEIVGSRIKVTNTDGSSHIEEIMEWQTNRRLRLHMKEFSRPLARLATGFLETWDFQRGIGGTNVIRSFELHARSVLTRPLLWVISLFLKKAIARHLAQMRDRASV
jgi:hypothetical protein